MKGILKIIILMGLVNIMAKMGYIRASGIMELNVVKPQKQLKTVIFLKEDIKMVWNKE